mmetsp:Transcript_17172/g.39666  ORF Transcript_17172/g.39666 Transcript_17172/m.39666 type:complete len:316 (-) Transcript_17172:203-1150(-)|eukprot:CAMPEP_0197187924 /NCGR_PEP_ID=MMETSP1423-20130617/16866_1 /TAXON_ID=476441 /ORGANISM="Pseudo-nitzschia heimii, Strain UNC1101" /LENGTH=315 /DNA_ID=CAMNT_0042639633 /DNA_START=134 /DNA_END=1081 /DNA_ORIENTATION=-
MATTATAHLVIPGQVIATSSTNPETDDNSNHDEGFLRGHGTYVEHDSATQTDRLVASVCGIVHRVNKLITVVPYCLSMYRGNVGDLVVGRITSVGVSRWTVSLHEGCKDAGLPLSGVHLPGGAQRLRTAQDSRNMRLFLREGDLVCAEVHKVQQADGSLSLHTRSHRFTKLENGLLVKLPPALIPRRKNHSVSLVDDTIDALWGVNGNIWLQRKMQGEEKGSSGKMAGTSDAMKDVADLQEKMRREHAETPVDVDMRRSLARLRNSIECIRMVHALCAPETAESVYRKSLELGIKNPYEMLLPEKVLILTEDLRD